MGEKKDDIKNLFIVQDDVGTQGAEALAKRALRFGRVTKDGSVVIDDKGLSKGDQLKLALVIRYIGSSLDETILRKIRPTEMTRTLGQRIEAVGAGLSTLAATGFAKKEGRGEYSVFPYKIESFLDYLEKGRGDSEATPKTKARGAKRGKTTQPLSGVGVHIQQLIDDGFFEKPKFVSNVIEKLQEENVFRDGRVIDKTIRDTFVSNRRVLQRIRNDGAGKARWLYVVRK